MVSERIQRQVERLLDEAEGAIANLDWEAVNRYVLAVLVLDPENVDGIAILAAANRALGLADSSLSNDSDQGKHAEELVEQLPSSDTRTPADLPTSFADGRYQIIRLLGEGGRKKTYLAHDNMLDRDVALALIKTSGLDEAVRARITREAQVMGRLGDHPNILSIHDFGHEPGMEGEQTGCDLSCRI